MQGIPARSAPGSTEKVVVFVDDARLLPNVAPAGDVVVISLDSQAADELAHRRDLHVRGISEYAQKRLVSYDELYDEFKDTIRERLEPKDPTRQSRFLFEVLWEDILLNVIGIHYVETLVEAVLDRERPTRWEFAISDPDLSAVFRSTVQRLS